MVAKIAPGSLWDDDDQKDEYARLMGRERLERQVLLANLSKGKCVCNTQKVKRRWDGNDKPTTKTVHDKSCPRWKLWMAEVTDARQ